MKSPSGPFKKQKRHDKGLMFKPGCLHGAGIARNPAPVFWVRATVSGKGAGGSGACRWPAKGGFWLVFTRQAVIL